MRLAAEVSSLEHSIYGDHTLGGVCIKFSLMIALRGKDAALETVDAVLDVRQI